MTDNLATLAERVEQAEGPSRALDAEIDRFNPAYEGGGYPLPHYTASLDAAMTLVDPRALWAVVNMEEGPIARLVWPQPDGGYVGGYIEARAATPALALAAAALRAKGSRNHDD